MARKTDIEEHARQKAVIAGAVWRLVGRGGLEAVSMSEVAREAGVSVGRLQYYFRGKDEMLLYGLKLAQERMEERIRERLGRLDSSVGEEEILRAIIAEVTGGDEDTRQAIRVSTAYLPRAQDDVQVAEILFDGDEELHDLARRVVRDALEDGRAWPDVDSEKEAQTIWSLANSLGIEVAFGRRSASDALELMEYVLDRSLGRRR